ncbi:MAG: histidine phosphatase family protein [Alphaproteobacteria bacterium]
MSRAPALYLARHGQTEWNLERRLQGGRDSPLTKLGERQAKAVAASLEATVPALVLASPLGRAKKTAEIIGRALGVPIEHDPRLGEMRMGEAEGLTLAQVDAAWPGFRDERERDKWHIRWPDGENYEDADRRIQGLVSERVLPALADAASGPLLVVGHETINMVLLGRLLGLEPAMTMRIGQPNHVLYRVDGRRVDHAYVDDGGLDWVPGMLQKRSDEILHVAA